MADAGSHPDNAVAEPPDNPFRCAAPGRFDGLDCEGPPGHPGPHGRGDERWTDVQAREYARAAEALDAPQEAPSGPPAVFRGVVHVRGRSAALRGVVTLLGDLVYVELVRPVKIGPGEQAGAVYVPAHQVLAIDVATEQAARP